MGAEASFICKFNLFLQFCFYQQTLHLGDYWVLAVPSKNGYFHSHWASTFLCFLDSGFQNLVYRYCLYKSDILAHLHRTLMTVKKEKNWMACDIIRLEQERMVRYKPSWDTYLLARVTWEFYVVNTMLAVWRRWGGLLSQLSRPDNSSYRLLQWDGCTKIPLEIFASGCCRPSHWDFPSSGSLFLAWTFAFVHLLLPCPLNLAFLNTYYVIPPPKILFLPQKQVQTL